MDRSARLSGWKEAARHCQRRNVKSHERDLTPRAPFHPPSFLLWQHLLVFSLLLLGHLHSAWRLPPPERHLHRLRRRPPPPPRPAHHHHHHHHLFHPQAASHHPHRKIIICHIHQYTVLSGLHLLSSFTIPLSFPPPFPPLLVFSPFLSLSLSLRSPTFLSFPNAWIPLLFQPSLLFFLPSACPTFTLRFLLSIPLPVRLCILVSFFQTQHGGRSFVLQMPLFLALSFIAHFVCSSFYAGLLPAAFLHPFAADVVSALLISALISPLGRVHAKICDERWSVQGAMDGLPARGILLLFVPVCFVFSLKIILLRRDV